MYEGKPVEETGGETCNAMQDGHFKEGGVLRKKKKTSASNGERTFGTSKLAVITREQQGTGGLLVAGRVAWRPGIKEERFHQDVRKGEGKIQL